QTSNRVVRVDCNSPLPKDIPIIHTLSNTEKSHTGFLLTDNQGSRKRRKAAESWKQRVVRYDYLAAKMAYGCIRDQVAPSYADNCADLPQRQERHWVTLELFPSDNRHSGR